MKIFFFISFIFLFSLVYSQDNINSIKSIFPNQDAICTQNTEEVNIFIKNNKINIVSNLFTERLFLSENAQIYADAYIMSNSFINVENINAYLLIPKNNNYSKSKINTIEVKDNMSNSVFFDDNKIYHITFPKIYSNYKTSVSYTEITKEPHFFQPFYFSSYLPCLKSRYIVNVSKDIDITFKIKNDFNNSITYSKIDKGNTITHIWESSNLKKYKFIDDNIGFSYYEPHIIIMIDNYKINGKKTTVSSSVDDLYKLYFGFIKNINKKYSPELIKTTDSLTKNLSNINDKIESIFYWVQNNIKYIAFEDGLEGFIPREADSIFKNRYGDCKDMSSLTYSMLKIAGIDAHLTWIGTRKIPYSYNETPSSIVDNHMIVSVKLNDKFVFLDATSDYIPLGMPSGFIQSKEALISVDSVNYIIDTVPIVSKEKNAFYDSTFIEFDTKNLKGYSHCQFNGYKKNEISAKLIRKQPLKQKEFLESELTRGNNKFKLDTFSFNDIYNRNIPLNIKYKFNTPNYVNTINNDIYYNINIDKIFYNEYIDTVNMNFNKYIENTILNKSYVKLDIPANFKIVSIPQNMSYKNNLFGFDIKYEITNNSIICNTEFYIDALWINKSMFKEWNLMIDNLNKCYNQTIHLKKTN